MIERSVAKLSSLADLHDAHPCLKSLLSSISQRDKKGYSLSYAELVRVSTIREDAEIKERLGKVMSERLPGFLEMVSSSINEHDWKRKLASFCEAWEWSHADWWLKKRKDSEHLLELEQRQEILSQKESNLLGSIASDLAWGHFFKRLSPAQENGLRAWQEVQRKMPKSSNTLKSETMRREARSHMQSCRGLYPLGLCLDTWLLIFSP